MHKEYIFFQAGELLNSIDNLPLSHVVMMAVTKGKEREDESFLISLYLLIGEIFGQTQITPMALAKMVILNKGTGVINDVSIKMLLEESVCSFEKAEEYVEEKYYESCHKSESISPCCNYFGNLASDPSILNFTLLTLKYAMPNFIYMHQPLADLLGLPYNHLDFSKRIGMTHMVLMCALPHGNRAPCTIPPEGFDILWTPEGYCVTFNEKAPNTIYKVRGKCFLIITPLLYDGFSNINLGLILVT